MSSKISFNKIFKDHYNTLVDQNTKKPGGDDLWYFLILPILLSFCIVYFFEFNFNKSPDLKKTLVSSLAIFVGLLFNALVMLINMAKDMKKENIKYGVTCQLISNISYSIIIAFFGVVLILTRYWEIPILIEIQHLPTTSQVFDFFILFVLLNFFFTFLMTMKRTYLIINSEV